MTKRVESETLTFHLQRNGAEFRTEPHEITPATEDEKSEEEKSRNERLKKGIEVDLAIVEMLCVC